MTDDLFFCGLINRTTTQDGCRRRLDQELCFCDKRTFKVEETEKKENKRGRKLLFVIKPISVRSLQKKERDRRAIARADALRKKGYTDRMICRIVGIGYDKFMRLIGPKKNWLKKEKDRREKV